MKLEKSPIPKYFQLKHLLAEQILDGTYEAGGRLPTVNALAAQFKVSRATANRAIMMLQEDDLLEIVPGVGSMVKARGDVRFAPESPSKAAGRRVLKPKSTPQWLDVLKGREVLFLGMRVEISTRELLSGNITGYVIAGIEAALMSADNSANVIFMSAQWESGANTDAIMRAISDHDIVGLIVHDYGDQRSSFGELVEMGRRVALLAEQSGLPVVLVGESIWGADSASIAYDDYECVRLLIEHLVSLGHQRIMFAGLKPFLWSARRADAFRKFAEAYSLSVSESDIALADNPELSCAEQGYEVGKRMLPSGDYTAVIAANDYAAVGVIRAAEELGLSIPRDISIAGIDNWPDCRYLNLTSVHIPWDEMGELALELLAKREQGDTLVSQVLVRPRLIVRKSTGQPRTGR